MYGDEILQQNWSLVASNVAYFNATGNCYVDKDNNLFIAGDSLVLGLGEDYSGARFINNYIKHPLSELQGKVSKVWCEQGCTWILKTDGKLLGTGYYIYNGSNYFPGWSDKNDKLDFVEILDNVVLFDSCISAIRFASTSDGKLYFWGDNWNRISWISRYFIIF